MHNLKKIVGRIKKDYRMLNRNERFIEAKNYVKSTAKNTVDREIRRAKKSGGNYLTLPQDINRLTDF